MIIGIVIFVIAVAVPIIYKSTRPRDTAKPKWPSKARRLPLIGGAAYIVFMWADMLTDIVSGWIVSFLFEGNFSETGMRPDYRYARNHRRDGERDLAIAAIKTELRKDPKNFEGLLMLAGIYEDLNQPAEALAQLRIILDNPMATDDQLRTVRQEEENCRQLQRHLDEVAAFKKHSET